MHYKSSVALLSQRGNHLQHVALGVVFLMILCVELCKPSGEDRSSTELPPLRTSTPDGSYLKTNIPTATPRLSKEVNDLYSRTPSNDKQSSEGIILMIGNESKTMDTNQVGLDYSNNKNTVTPRHPFTNQNPETFASSSETPLKSLPNYGGSNTKPSRSLSLLWLYSKNEKTLWPKEKPDIASIKSTGKTPEAGDSTSSTTTFQNLLPSTKSDERNNQTQMTLSPSPYIKIKGFVSSAIVSNGGNKPPISSPFTGSIVAPQKSLVPPEASPSFIDPRVLLTSGIGSRTVLLHPVASKTQSQRMQNVSPTPTPYPTTRPHYCDIGSQSCICMNCEGNTNNGFACCTDLIEQENIDEGVVLSLSSISFEEFKNKILKLQSLLRDIVTDHCTGTSCYQNVHSKRLRRNLISDQTGQETGIRNPEQYIRSWDGSPITPSNTIRPYSRKKSPIRNLLSTTVTPTLGRPVAVDVVVFKIAPNAGQNKKLSTGMYVSLTSLVDGTNQTYILKGDILSSLIRRKRDVFKRKLNITIDSVIKWSTWRDMQSIGPRMAESATQSGSTTAFGPSVIPGEGTPNMEGREGRNSTANMSRKTFIIVLVTGIGGFVVLAIIIIYMLVKFLRRMKGEFVPDKIYPNEQKSNSGSEQLIPSFVDPSTPRITDVPKKTVRSGSSGTGGGQGSGGTKKQKKPMGVKVTYKPPKWD